MNQIRPVDSVAQLAVNVTLLLQMDQCVLVGSSGTVTELSVEMESAEFSCEDTNCRHGLLNPKQLRAQQIPRSALQVSQSSIFHVA